MMRHLTPDVVQRVTAWITRRRVSLFHTCTSRHPMPTDTPVADLIRWDHPDERIIAEMHPSGSLRFLVECQHCGHAWTEELS